MQRNLLSFAGKLSKEAKTPYKKESEWLEA